MFNLFKRKTTPNFFAVCDGQFKSITKVNDAVFSEKMVGDGFAITPCSGKVDIYSPVKGKVLSVFPTKHAITFLTNDGLEVLIHMGLDTVALNGEGFEIYVKEGDKVNETTLLAKMNVDLVKEKNKDTDIIIVVTNLAEKNTFQFLTSGTVITKQLIATLI